MTHAKTKAIKTAVLHHAKSDKTSLLHCYAKPSDAKHIALQYCQELVRKYNGESLKIIGFNTSHFSVGFYGKIDGKDAFFYITPYHNRYIFVDEL